MLKFILTKIFGTKTVSHILFDSVDQITAGDFADLRFKIEELEKEIEKLKQERL